MVMALQPSLNRLPGLGAVFLVACATASTPRPSSVEREPAWISEPSPRRIGGQRCYHDQATDIPSRDDAHALARQRALTQIIADLGVTVESRSVAYQAEANGALTVWVGEETSQRTLGNIWDITERDRFSTPTGEPPRHRAHVLVCVSEQTFGAMKAQLAQLHERLLQLAIAKLEQAEGALDGRRPKGVGDLLETVASALRDLPPIAAGDLNTRLAAAAQRLRTGFAVALADNAAMAPTSDPVTGELELRVTFESQPVSGLWLACGESPPCAIAHPTDARGAVMATVGPWRTAGIDELALALGIELSQGAEPIAELSVRIPVRVPDHSVLLCCDDPGTTAHLTAALSDRGLLVAGPEACTETNRAAFGRLLITASKRSGCEKSYGDFQCSVTFEAVTADLIAPASVGTDRGHYQFIHPKKQQAQASATRAALEKLSAALTERVASYLRALRSRGK